MERAATAVRSGAICYLDEVVEARQDTTVVIHPLTDRRRVLPLDKKGEVVAAHPDFQLVVSYNPGYQSLMKDLKQSTKQRFAALDFDYPAREIEVVARSSHGEKRFTVKVLLLTPKEVEYYRHGGILPYVLRQLAGAKAA